MVDCQGCKHRPSVAQANAEGGDGMYCTQFSEMPQTENCMGHSRYDAAKAEGNARIVAKRVGAGNTAGPTGSYLHLPKQQIVDTPVRVQ